MRVWTPVQIASRTAWFKCTARAVVTQPPCPHGATPPQVPIAVCCPLTRRWHIVHWFDSKAGFGDDRSHATALAGQYATYVNRYGSGAVIYWAGFVADLATHASSGAHGDVVAGGAGASAAADVLILDRFPEVLQLLTPAPSMH